MPIEPCSLGTFAGLGPPLYTRGVPLPLGDVPMVWCIDIRLLCVRLCRILRIFPVRLSRTIRNARRLVLCVVCFVVVSRRRFGIPVVFVPVDRPVLLRPVSPAIALRFQSVGYTRTVYTRRRLVRPMSVYRFPTWALLLCLLLSIVRWPSS